MAKDKIILLASSLLLVSIYFFITQRKCSFLTKGHIPNSNAESHFILITRASFPLCPDIEKDLVQL
jgi:hypothetical protein